MPTDSKSLLTTQLSSSESTFGGSSGVASDFDRSSPSPTSMLSAEESHHYANPQEIKKDIQVEMDKIDGRKKRNLLYEPLPILKEKPNGFHRPRRDSFENSDVSLKQVHRDRLIRFLFVVVFLLSLGAFLLSILTSFGLINTCGGSCRQTETRDASSKGTTPPLIDDQKLKDLERNLSALNAYVIPSLMSEITILKAKLANESFHGPSGPIGPVGPQGPAGAGDLSKCRYRQDVTESPFASPQEATQTSTLGMRATAGYVVIGATCSTVGGSQHGLHQKQQRGEYIYQCKCGGKSIANAFKDTKLTCYIHLWECPLKT